MDTSGSSAIESKLLHVGQSISVESAKQLSISTNTVPQITSITPRWLLRMLPWVDVPTGIFRINQVKYIEKTTKIKLCDLKNLTPEFLKFIPLFSNIKKDLINDVFNKMEEKEFSEGDVIFKQGTKGDGLYVILSGSLDVSIKGRKQNNIILKTLEAGDYFGEMSLVEDKLHNATVTAATKAKILYLKKSAFAKIFQDEDFKKYIKRVHSQRASELTLATQYEEALSPLLAGQHGEPLLPKGFADFTQAPKELHLNVIQTIVSIHTRIIEIYNIPHDQLSEQIRITIENIREREEWEIINNNEFGLLQSVTDNMTIGTKNGPPTPDDLDDLLSLVWKKPAFFLAHPNAIAAFGRECTYRGVPPVVVELFGSKFITWRGIPLIPSDKMMINYDSVVPTTNILLMRVGEENQGVVGLHKMAVGNSKVPSLSVQFMEINDRSISNYLLTKYFSVAVLVPDALAVLKNVEIGGYHTYDYT